MTDLRQTPEYARYMQNVGWSVVGYQVSDVSCQVFARRIQFFGSIAKLQRPRSLPTAKQIDQIRKRCKLAAFYIEPSFGQDANILGFDFSKTCFLPPKTIQINLSQSLEQIVSQMKKEARYSLKLAERFGIRVEKSRDIEAFIKLWHQSARRRKSFFSQEKEIKALWSAFGKKAHLLLAFSNPKQPLAGTFIARSVTTAYYMYAASTREGNKLSTPTFLVWEAVKLAKKAGCKIFDFEGIYDERYPQTKSWKGFSRFKEGFGGKTVEYPRALVKYYNPILKVLHL